MGDVNKFFLDPISRQFSLPKTMENDPLAWQKDYDDALAFYSDTVLDVTAKRIIASRDVRSFPLVAECLKACRETHGELSKPEPRSAGHHDEWDQSRVKRADRLIQSDAGVQAAKEGWLLSLWDFCRQKERWPNRIESEKMCSEFKKRVQETNEFFNKELASGRPMMKTVKGYFASREARLARLTHLVDEYRDSRN